MATVLSWLHICTHFVPLHAWQIFDEQHMKMHHMNQCQMKTNENELDEEEVQNILLHHQDILKESAD
jgi:hypothetical protein